LGFSLDRPGMNLCAQDCSSLFFSAESGGASIVLAPEMPDTFDMFRNPVNSDPFWRYLLTTSGEVWLLLPPCMFCIRSLVGGAAAMLDGNSTPSLAAVTVPELERSFC